MLFVSDERGGFNLATPGFESSLWATLVCPPSLKSELESFVRSLCDELGLDELHAHELDDTTRMRIACMLASKDIIWGATVIDSEIFPAAEVEPWRRRQVEKFREAWDRSERGGTLHPYYEGHGEPTRRLLENPRLVPLPLYVQFAIVAPRHVHDCVQAAVRRYQAPQWHPDWLQPRLIFDQKDIGRNRGHELVKKILFPILASAEMTLDLPVGYQDPGHPIHARRRASGDGIELPAFFGGEPVFVDSAEDPLIQLVDVIAWIAGRALLFPTDRGAQAAYAQLRLRQFKPPDLAARFRFFSRRPVYLEDLSRYRHLVA